MYRQEYEEIYINNPDDPINFDWHNVLLGMAFEDIYGNVLWFQYTISKNTLLGMFFNNKDQHEITHKLALIRTPEWDNQYTLLQGVN